MAKACFLLQIIDLQLISSILQLRELEDLEKRFQAQSHEFEKERSAKEKLESHIKAAVDARNQMQSEMEHRGSEFERVSASGF
jgi:hypothetical protein